MNSQRGGFRRRLGTIGGDGLFTLLLSNLLMLATAGLSLGLSLSYVIRTARDAQIIPPDRSVLVVLGMRLKHGEVSDDYALRLRRAARIYAQTKNRTVLAVGGYTSASPISEASKGREYLIAMGLKPEHVLVEDASRHTLENLRNVRALLAARGLDHFTLITNRYHLARSRAIAEGLGMKPALCAAEDEFAIIFSLLPRLLLEAYYIQWYHTGAIWSRLTQNKKSLERIS